MVGTETPKFIWRINLDDEDATRCLARELVHILLPDDLITLSGDLGSGKTAFARAVIRELMESPDIEVPSPTFTLMQVYQAKRCPIVHADLYRLKSPDELAQLDWDESAEGAIVLVEWADRAGDQLPSDRLDVAFELDLAVGENARGVTLSGAGNFARRLARAKAIHDLIAKSAWAGARREFMQGDASARAYERLQMPNGECAILMISPPRPDGPPLGNGKPYSAVARLAENIVPFIAVDAALKSQSLSAPTIIARDLNTGLAILEDFGAEGIVNGDGPIQDRYAESVAVLAYLHGKELSATLPLEGGQTYTVPPYDLDALLVEVELLLDWYVPEYAPVNVSPGARTDFVDLWKPLLTQMTASRSTWTLRDYHSPNIIWLPDRQGLQRVGLLDFQDCVMGNPAYDVVSILQDARVTVSDEMEIRLISHYARKRRDADANFDMASFARHYALLGAQRATKILGIFARLNKRDNKPQYLAHLPRVERYLTKDLAHPALADLKFWYENHLPGLFDSAP